MYKFSCEIYQKAASLNAIDMYKYYLRDLL